MILIKDRIDNFNIPKVYIKELLDVLEKGLKGIETELDDKIVYGVINNIIKDRYESNEDYKRLSKSFLLDLTKEIISGKGNKKLINLWYNLSNRVLYHEKSKMIQSEAFKIEYGVDLNNEHK